MPSTTIKYRKRNLRTDSLVRKCRLGIKTERWREKNNLNKLFYFLNLRFLDVADLCHCFIVRISSTSQRVLYPPNPSLFLS